MSVVNNNFSRNFFMRVTKLKIEHNKPSLVKTYLTAQFLLNEMNSQPGPTNKIQYYRQHTPFEIQSTIGKMETWLSSAIDFFTVKFFIKSTQQINSEKVSLFEARLEYLIEDLGIILIPEVKNVNLKIEMLKIEISLREIKKSIDNKKSLNSIQKNFKIYYKNKKNFDCFFRHYSECLSESDLKGTREFRIECMKTEKELKERLPFFKHVKNLHSLEIDIRNSFAYSKYLQQSGESLEKHNFKGAEELLTLLTLILSNKNSLLNLKSLDEKYAQAVLFFKELFSQEGRFNYNQAIEAFTDILPNENGGCLDYFYGTLVGAIDIVEREKKPIFKTTTDSLIDNSSY